MLTRIVSVSLLVGVVAGLALAAMQHFTTTPMILKAETYESQSSTSASGATPHPTSGPAYFGARLILAHGDEPDGDAADGSTGKKAWAPADGVERLAYTALTTVGTSVGFTLILLSLMLLAGETITLQAGLAWGAAAFVACGLAPAFGLAPELPGAAAIDVTARQTWWFGTVIATAFGLACLLRTNNPAIALAGVVLIALPHIIGAPHPHAFASQVPAELAAQFSATALGLQAALWGMIGAGAGAAWARGGQQSADRP